MIRRWLDLVLIAVLASVVAAGNGPGLAQAAYAGHDGVIAFTNATGIYVVDPNGTAKHRILKTPITIVGGLVVRLAVHVSWSPNGRWLAFDDGQPVAKIYRMRANGLSLAPVMTGSDPSYGRRGALTFVRSVHQESHIFVKLPGHPATDLGRGEDPEWSPSGSRIGFRCSDDICIMNADGSNGACVTCAAGRYGESPSWAPGGRRIAFQYDEDLFIIRVDGSGLRRLTTIPNASGGAIEPAWSPSGRWIAYRSTDRFGRISIKKIRVSDGKEMLVTYDTAVFPAWQSLP